MNSIETALIALLEQIGQSDFTDEQGNDLQANQAYLNAVDAVAEKLAETDDTVGIRYAEDQ